MTFTSSMSRRRRPSHGDGAERGESRLGAMALNAVYPAHWAISRRWTNGPYRRRMRRNIMAADDIYVIHIAAARPSHDDGAKRGESRVGAMALNTVYPAHWAIFRRWANGPCRRRMRRNMMTTGGNYVIHVAAARPSHGDGAKHGADHGHPEWPRMGMPNHPVFSGPRGVAAIT